MQQVIKKPISFEYVREPATAKQIKMLKSLKVDHDPDISKYKAAVEIKKALAPYVVADSVNPGSPNYTPKDKMIPNMTYGGYRTK